MKFLSPLRWSEMPRLTKRKPRPAESPCKRTMVAPCWRCRGLSEPPRHVAGSLEARGIVRGWVAAELRARGNGGGE